MDWRLGRHDLWFLVITAMIKVGVVGAAFYFGQA
jgi:hypothetical protein